MQKQQSWATYADSHFIRLLGISVNAFVARGLYSHWSHHVCYSAVVTGGVVLILPGFQISMWSSTFPDSDLLFLLGQ